MNESFELQILIQSLLPGLIFTAFSGNFYCPIESEPEIQLVLSMFWEVFLFRNKNWYCANITFSALKLI